MPIAAKPQPTPPASTTSGSTSADAAPATGIADWRIPIASPRSWCGNQCMTARPLAAATLAPPSPASASSTQSPPKLVAPAAASIATPAAASPPPTTQRSPTRSAATPHGSIPSIVPTFAAASSSPVCASVSPYSLRTSGSITGRPIVNTENVACAVVPTARTVQR